MTARELGRDAVGFYLGVSHYVNNWRRPGFSADDGRPPGSGRRIHTVVAHGNPDTGVACLAEHPQAGWERLPATLTELAGPLGPATRGGRRANTPSPPPARSRRGQRVCPAIINTARVFSRC